jgi:hypothetical protein
VDYRGCHQYVPFHLKTSILFDHEGHEEHEENLYDMAPSCSWFDPVLESKGH